MSARRVRPPLPRGLSARAVALLLDEHGLLAMARNELERLREPMDAKAVRKRASDMFFAIRNAAIREYAYWLLHRHGAGLLRHEDCIWDIVDTIAPDYMNGVATSEYGNDPDEVALCLAYGVATARWYIGVNRGLHPATLGWSVHQVEVWLEANTNRQLALL